MKEKFFKLFKTAKPIIAMVHFPALPGSPLYDSKLGLDYILESTEKDLIALQNAGVDAVMFGNENDRPYELNVNTATTFAEAMFQAQGLLQTKENIILSIA